MPTTRKRARQAKTVRRSNQRFLEAPVRPPLPPGATSDPFDGFEDADLLAWLARADLPSGVSAESIPILAGQLNQAVTMFLVRRQLAQADTPKAVETWARQVEGYARSLLFALGADPGEAPTLARLPPDLRQYLHPGLNPDAALREQAFRALPATLGLGARDTGASATGPGFSPWPILDRTPAAIATLMLAARRAGDLAARATTGGRPPHPGRRDFFAETVGTFEALTNREAGVSRVNTGKDVGGPCVRFHLALLATLRERLTEEVIADDTGVVEALTLTSGQVAEAIKTALAE